MEEERQCKWRSGKEHGDANYTAPLLILRSSTDGIMEYRSKHFGGQLLGNLILGRYRGELWRVVLNANGTEALADEVLLDPNGGLDVTQGPDGTLFVAQNGNKKVVYLEALDLPSKSLTIKSIFPRRGHESGGSRLSVYGEKLDISGVPTVTVGGLNCPIKGAVTSSKISCTLPAGTGTVDVMVTSGTESDTFVGAYRYIIGETPTMAPTTSAPTVKPTPTPTKAPTSTGGGMQITQFVLVDAYTDEDVIGGFDCDPACIGSTTKFDIRAETSGEVGSVNLTLTGPIKTTRIENVAPYSQFGDVRGNYRGFNMPYGSYTITAQPFSLSDGGGTPGPSKSFQFSLEESTTPSPTVQKTDTPTRSPTTIADCFPNQISDCLHSFADQRSHK